MADVFQPAGLMAGVSQLQSGESSMSVLKADADEIPQEPPKGPSAEHQVWSRPKTGPVLMNSDVQQTGGGRQGAEPERVTNQVKSVGSPPLVVEVFAGKASLSRALLEAGFAVLSVDHEIKDPQTPIAALDLTTQSGQVVLWSMLEQPNLFAVHLGVPCGTSSRARERPVPKHLIRLGAPSPKPLRSGAHPLGVPGLSPINQARVDSANTLYKLTLDVTLHCLAKGIGVSIENPANSWTWAVFVALLVRDYDDSAKRLYNSLQPVLFHSCCHGGQRERKQPSGFPHRTCLHLLQPSAKGITPTSLSVCPDQQTVGFLTRPSRQPTQSCLLSELQRACASGLCANIGHWPLLCGSRTFRPRF